MCKLAEELAESEVRARVRHVSGESAVVILGNCLTTPCQGVPLTRVRMVPTLSNLSVLLAELLIQFCSLTGSGQHRVPSPFTRGPSGKGGPGCSSRVLVIFALARYNVVKIMSSYSKMIL
jgi:hypothetical protein